MFAFVRAVIGAMCTAPSYVRAWLEVAICEKQAVDINGQCRDGAIMRLGSDVTDSGSGKK